MSYPRDSGGSGAPTLGLCGRCNGIHTHRDVDGEVFAKCIRCQAELVEIALTLRYVHIPFRDPWEVEVAF